MLNQHQTIKDNIAKYNKLNPLVDYLLPYIENKKEVKILDVGSGAYSTIGHYLPEVKLEMYHCDNQDFRIFYQKYHVIPLVKIEWQNMEHLTYPANTFDIIHCANALDHTKDAYQAVKEMMRVCKTDGWIYIDCHLDQKDTGHKHKWNVKADGTLTDTNEVFNLKNFGFTIQFIDNGGESRYNHIIATLKKAGDDK